MKYFNDFIIDSSKIIENIKNYSNLCAMVKANAYGLGLGEIVKIINKYVYFYGVANSCEAMKLRKLTQRPILVCGKTDYNYYKSCLQNNISLTVDTICEIKQINKICLKYNLIAKIHIKINTGMNRLGVNSLKLFFNMVDEIKKCDNLILEGIFTHFSSANCNLIYLQKQYKNFMKYINKIDCSKVIIHCSNTDASNIKNYNFDMVRIGLGIYKNAITIKSRVIKLQDVKLNQYVGYAPNFFSKKNIKIAIVPIGYADGILRCYSNNGKVIINNKLYNIVGSICMDMFFVEIDNSVKLNDEVIILGKSNNHALDEIDMAKACNTIPYEILTNFNKGRFNKFII